jgi:hypothetical protein
VIALSDVVAYDYGDTTYTIVLNDEEFNLVILLLGTLTSQEIFADYDDDKDLADAILADALEGIMTAIP